MAQQIKIKLDTSKYKVPTQEDIAAAKRFINLREEYAGVLGERIDAIIADGAERIVTICYQYNADPKTLYFSSAFNSDMMSEISEVMDDIEGRILSLIYEYSTRVTDDRDRISILAAWMALLGKGGNNLQDTLDGYLYKMMKDWEAAIAALRYHGVPLADAINIVKSHMHSIYTIPQVVATFKRWREFAATYIRSRGIQYGAVGISNNGSTNVVNMGKITLQMTWMHNQGLDFKEQGAVGYLQLRGSNYNCDICDSESGFYPDIEEIFTKAYPHPNCMCFRVPVFSKEDIL